MSWKNKFSLKAYWIKYRWWLIILLSFISVRIVIFVTFWQASLGEGGWNYFYGLTDLYYNVVPLKRLFSQMCGSFPLYFTFTSTAQFLWDNQWSIYISQILFSLLSLIISYKLLRLFFGNTISLITVFIFAVEPYTAWYNFLFGSENFYTPIILGSLYFFFLFLQTANWRQLVSSALLLGMANLTRANSLYLEVLLSVIILFLHFFGYGKLAALKAIGMKKIMTCLFIFNILSLIFVFGLMYHNKIKYDDFRIGVGTANNIYYFNAPELLSIKNNITYDQAKVMLLEKVDNYMGRKIRNFADCRDFSNAEMIKLFDYVRVNGRKYIMNDFGLYLKIHLIKTIPYFIQPGYHDMYIAYTGDNIRPNITTDLIKGNWSELFNFFSKPDLSTTIFIIGPLWGMICLFALFSSIIYTYFKDREKFYFFVFSFLIIFYNAMMVSPFANARYRISIYPFFIVPLVYMVDIGIKSLRNRRKTLPVSAG